MERLQESAKTGMGATYARALACTRCVHLAPSSGVPSALKAPRANMPGTKHARCSMEGLSPLLVVPRT